MIINLCPTGMIPTKEMTEYVPVSPAEIIEDALSCIEFGASMVHIHARDCEGNPTWSMKMYEKIICGIRKHNKEVILCVSTSGRNWPDFKRRSACLDVDGVDMASLTLSSLNFNKQASVNSPEMIQALADKMVKRGIKPELEAFDIGMINVAKYLFKHKFISPPFYFNLILGNIACAQANMLNLGLMVSELPEGSIWSVGGVGSSQLKMNIMGMMNGGGVRVGLEDYIYMDEDRTYLATNLALVKRIRNIADEIGIGIESPIEVRKRLNIRPQKSPGDLTPVKYAIAS